MAQCGVESPDGVSQKEHQLVPAIKGAAYKIKKQEFRSDGRKRSRQPLPCPVYKLGCQFWASNSIASGLGGGAASHGS